MLNYYRNYSISNKNVRQAVYLTCPDLADRLEKRDAHGGGQIETAHPLLGNGETLVRMICE